MENECPYEHGTPEYYSWNARWLAAHLVREQLEVADDYHVDPFRGDGFIPIEFTGEDGEPRKYLINRLGELRIEEGAELSPETNEYYGITYDDLNRFWEAGSIVLFGKIRGKG